MSFNKIVIPFNFNIEFLITDNTINGNAKKIIKQVKKKFKYKIYYFNEKKRGIVHARNKCLAEAKKINCNYFSFLDDDCEIDTKWFVNFKKPLIDIFPGLEIVLFNLFETLKDIKLFIIDLS